METVKVDRRTWEILTEKIDRFDEYGFPDIDGEYDIYGWPLSIL